MNKKGKIVALSFLSLALSTISLVSCGSNQEEKEEYSVTVNNDSTKGSFELYTVTEEGRVENEDLKFTEGEELVLVVTPLNDIEVTSLTFNGTEVSYPDGGYQWTTTAQNYTITINYYVPPTVYSLSVTNDATKGSVTTYKVVNGVREEATTYIEGDQMVAVIAPEFGYKVGSVTLDGSELEVTNNEVSFTCLDQAHTLVVNYVDNTYELNYRYYSYYITSMSVTSNEEVVTSGSQVKEGTSVTVTLNVNYSSYASNAFIDVNGVTYQAENITTDSQTGLSVLTFDVEMPSEDTLIFASISNYLPSENGTHSFTFEGNENVKVYGFQGSENKYEQVAMFIIEKTSNYSVSSATVLDSEGNEISTLPGARLYFSPANEEGYAYCTLTLSVAEFQQYSDVTIRFNGYVLEEHTISYTNLDEVSCGTGSSFLESVMAESQVTVSGIVANDSTKYISAINITSTDSSFSCTPTRNGVTWSYSFVMPNASVSIEFVISSYSSLSVTSNETTLTRGTDYVITEQTYLYDSSIYSGNLLSNVSYTLWVKEVINGEIVTGASLNGTSLLNPSSTNYNGVRYVGYRFTMGSSDSVISIETQEGYSITFSQNQHVQVSYSGNSVVRSGSYVSFNVSALTGFRVTGVKVVGETSQNEVTVSTNTYGSSMSVSFTMPSENVVVATEVEALESASCLLDIVDNRTNKVTETPYSSFNLYVGGTSVTPSSETFTYVEGSSISFNVYYSDSSVDLKVYYLNSSEEWVEVTSVSSSMSGLSGGWTPSEMIYGLRFEFVDREKVSATFNVDPALSSYNITYSYTVDGRQVENLDNVYRGSQVVVTATSSDLPSNMSLQVTLTGDNVTASYYGGGYVVNSDFVINVSVAQVYTFTVSNSMSDASSFTCYLSATDYSQTIYSGNSITSSNKSYYLNISYYSGNSYDFTLTVGGEVVDSGTNLTSYYSGYSHTFTIDGDVVLTITPSQSN